MKTVRKRVAPSAVGDHSDHVHFLVNLHQRRTDAWNFAPQLITSGDSYAKLLVRQILIGEKAPQPVFRRLADLLRGQPAALGIPAVLSADPRSVLLARHILQQFDSDGDLEAMRLFPTEDQGVRIQRSEQGVTRSVEIEPHGKMTARRASVQPLDVEEWDVSAPAQAVEFLSL